MPSANVFDPTNHTALLTGTSWHNGSGSVTYSISTSGVDALSVIQQQFAHLAMAKFNEVCGLNASFAVSGGEITWQTVLDNNTGLYGYAYYPGPGVGGDIFLNNNNSIVANPTLYDEGWDTFIHELGHAVGLAHPFDGPTRLPTILDNSRYTIMSYDPIPDQAGIPDPTQQFPITPMLYDIQALQVLYGANMSTRTANDVYFVGDGPYAIANGGSAIVTIWDAGGIDTFSGAAQTSAVSIDLRPGFFSTIGSITNNIGIALGVAGTTALSAVIENATGGSAGDTLMGNDIGNTLNGLAGNDFITGGLGQDIIDGGSDNDTADYSEKTGAISMTLNGANFVFQYTAGVWEDSVRNFENVNGGSAGDTLTGDSLANVLVGGGGNDTLRGGGGLDTLDGGLNIDTVNYSAEILAVSLTLNGATDATATINGVAADIVRNIENLNGGSAGDTLNGDGLANTFNGNGGADILRGNGGIDTLNGGAGNDTLFGGAAVDVLDGGADIDTVDYSAETLAVSTTLNTLNFAFLRIGGVHQDSLKNIENVIGGSGADVLVGDGLVNVFNGNGGNDTFRGGAGVDVLDGGADSDTADYSAETLAVTTTLNTSNFAFLRIGGVHQDSIKNIENVIGGSGADVLVGDGLVNVFNGNGGNDTFRGGAGVDVLDGGADVDTVDYSAETLAVTTTLNTLNFAFLRIGGVHQDSLKNIENVIGGSAGDTLIGDAANNTFAGGLGNDALNGNGGLDTFRFDTILGATNIDTITGFVVADDTIELENLIFAGLASGIIGAANLSLTGAAVGIAAQVIYNTATGALSFDADGTNGGSTAQVFANVGVGQVFTVNDFIVT